MATLMNKTKNRVIVENLEVAKNFNARNVGLLGRSQLNAQDGLWIKPCQSIHTFFMQFAIDAAFVDRNLKVRAIYKTLKPWKLVWPLSLRVLSVFELSAGRLDETQTEIGDELYVVAENS